MANRWKRTGTFITQPAEQPGERPWDAATGLTLDAAPGVPITVSTLYRDRDYLTRWNPHTHEWVLYERTRRTTPPERQ